MKIIKLLLVSLLAMLGLAAEAQKHVAFYKEGQVVTEYNTNELDSIIYCPAPIFNGDFYYYWGPAATSTRPNTEAELKTNTYSHKIVNSRPESLTFTEDKTMLFIYPNVWGIGRFYKGFDAEQGQDSTKDINIPGYNAVSFKLTTPETRKIVWHYINQTNK